MIRVEDLSFTYPGATDPTIRGISFEIADGEVFGFLGPSGAGKSTTQKVLTRLLPGFAGKVEIMDRALTSWGPAYFSHIGVSFESPNHYLKLTARENLSYFRSLYDGPCETVEQVMAWVGLEGDLDKRVADYSKGMKNRLNFARSLLHRPKLWFLDEPTSGLDPVNARRVHDLVKERQDLGITTFLTTHDMHVANSLCDRVAFIVDGKIEAIDSPAALRKAYGTREIEVAFKAATAGDSGDPSGSVVEAQTRRFPLDGLADNDAFQRILRESRIETLHSQETTLEDVFIQVTGRGLKA